MDRYKEKSTMLNLKRVHSKADNRKQINLSTDLSIKSNIPPIQSLIMTQYLEIIRKIQLKCIHKKTIWLDEPWTFGHYSGFEIKYCQICGKKLKRRKIKDDCKW